MERKLVLFLFSLLITCLFFSLSGLLVDFAHGFSPALAFRFQTEAFLHGQSQLSADPFVRPSDCAWGVHGLEQQWGLGVPLIRLPFEILAKSFGWPAFPDRYVLAGLYLLVVFSFLSTFFSESRQPWYELLLVFVCACLVFISSPLMELAQSKFGQYEEAVLYLALTTLLVLTLILRIQREYSSVFLVTIGIILGFAFVIRPTAFAYCVASLVVLVPMALRHKSVLKVFFLSSLGIFAGLAFVLITNSYRFASPFEFGHGLNLATDPLTTFALRFDYLYKHEPFFSAARELLSVLFFPYILNFENFSAADLFLGQSKTMRIREIYFAPYGPLLAALLLTSLLLMAVYFLCRKQNLFMHINLDARIQLLWIWGGVSFLLLFGFYLWSPSITSRYLIDFYPSFVALLSAIFLFASEVFRTGLTKFWRVAFCFGFIVAAVVLLVFQIVGSPGTELEFAL